jgi:hypothetical protein
LSCMICLNPQFRQMSTCRRRTIQFSKIAERRSLELLPRYASPALYLYRLSATPLRRWAGQPAQIARSPCSTSRLNPQAAILSPCNLAVARTRSSFLVLSVGEEVKQAGRLAVQISLAYLLHNPNPKNFAYRPPCQAESLISPWTRPGI